MWVDVQNIGKEIAFDAGFGMLQGATIAAVTDQDILKGLVDGAVKSALLSSVKVALLGVRYNPMVGKNPEGPGLLPEITNRYGRDSIFRDHSYLAPEIRGQGMPKLEGVQFRRNGLIPRIIGDRSIVLASNVNLANGDHYNTSVLAHEIRHIHQQQLMTFGSAEFYTRYLLQATFSSAWEHRYKASPLNTTFEPYHGH